jgi:regulator of replication initiation timing
LESWYALQDEIEDNILGATTAEKTKATMQAQIETTLRQLMVVTRRIQEVASENEALRQEIISLRRQLANLSSVQQAT